MLSRPSARPDRPSHARGGYSYDCALALEPTSYHTDEALVQCRLAFSAYMDEDGPGELAGDDLPWVDKAGLRATLAGALGGAWPRPLLLRRFIDDEMRDTQAFVVSTEGGGAADLAMVCRGTTNVADWVSNVRFFPTKWEPARDGAQAGTSARAGPLGSLDWAPRLVARMLGIKHTPLVHTGFYEAFLPLRQHVDWMVEQVMNDPDFCNVNFTGHSLGGAIATLAFCYFVERAGAAELAARGVRLTLFTFGQPKVGTQSFVSHLRDVTEPLRAARMIKMYRVRMDADVVPTVPSGLMGSKHWDDKVLFARCEESHPASISTPVGVYTMLFGKTADAAMAEASCAGDGDEGCCDDDAMRRVDKVLRPRWRSGAVGKAFDHHTSHSYLGVVEAAYAKYARCPGHGRLRQGLLNEASVGGLNDLHRYCKPSPAQGGGPAAAAGGGAEAGAQGGGWAEGEGGGE